VTATESTSSTVDTYSPMALGNGIYARSDRTLASASDARLARASTTQIGSATRPQPLGLGHRLTDRGIGDTSWS
jgi:hypothetical protein